MSDDTSTADASAAETTESISPDAFKKLQEQNQRLKGQLTDIEKKSLEEIPHPSLPEGSSIYGGTKVFPDLQAENGETYFTIAVDGSGTVTFTQSGDVNLWQKIHEANKDVVASPDGLRPGMILRIP